MEFRANNCPQEWYHCITGQLKAQIYYLFIYLFWPSVDKKSYLMYKTPLFLRGLREVVSKKPYSHWRRKYTLFRVYASSHSQLNGSHSLDPLSCKWEETYTRTGCIFPNWRVQFWNLNSWHIIWAEALVIALRSNLLSTIPNVY